MKTIWILLLPLAFLLACQNPASKKNVEQKTLPDWSLEKVWSSDTLLKTCESVLFDSERQVLFVSCINGAPWEKDGKGFIALVNPDGSLKMEHWVSGLDAPKGMGMSENLLYVADIDRIVVIDIETGEIVREIPVDGATNLNDIAVGPGGSIYISDSGTGWIWSIQDGELLPWIEGGFARPNGLYVEKDRILLASSQSSDLKVIDKNSRKFETVTTEIGHGDGIEFTGEEGHYLVSSWSGEIFLVLPDFSKISLLKTSDQEINSADLGFNMAEQLVYVPTFFDNRVVAYKLVKTD